MHEAIQVEDVPEDDDDDNPPSLAELDSVPPMANVKSRYRQESKSTHADAYPHDEGETP